jgi:hypothetical protein
VEAWLAKPDGHYAMALRAKPEWPHDQLMVVEDTQVRIVPCPTPLAARAALHERAEKERIVLLTELTDAQLGDGLLAHLSAHTVRSVDPWELVAQMFGATVDPTLVQTGRWAALALTDYAPADGWPAPPGQVLTREHALRSLAAQLLGLDREQIDSAGLLQWTTDPAKLLGFVALPDVVLDGITDFLKETGGPAVVPILAAVRAGHGVDAIPLGLLAGVLWPNGNGSVGTEALVARTRLEPRFGNLRLTDRQAHEWRDAAEAWVDRAIDTNHREEARRMLDRAEAIAAEIDATALLASSTVLPSGFTQRLRAFASAVRLAVPAGAAADLAAVARAQSALAALEDHRAGEPRRLETARMAVRLLRWLSKPDGSAPATLYEALLRHVREDGWVDRARLDIFAGDTDPHVAEAYHLLYRAVDGRRARHDEQFARHLQAATATDAEPGAMVRVEDVLERVVKPILTAGRRVLLLVMDGMGVAAATELAESVTRGSRWFELTQDGAGRTGVLAALPSVTEVSRYSLLSGRIGTGGQAEERQALAARVPAAVLLHKGALRAGAGAVFDRDVHDALTNPERQLVAAVVNTIDDSLDRSNPGTVVWDTDTLDDVRALLSVAQDRIVVMVSDHGHVVDRGPEAVTRPGPDSDNRWRSADRAPEAGELLFAGRRVAAGGGRVVLPWREELRYGPRKAGYHGGASPAEMVIPLLVFATTEDQSFPGWSGAPVATPDWWREPVPEAPPPAAGPRPPMRFQRPIRPASQDQALFELPSVPATTPVHGEPSRPPLVQALLASEIYAQRRDPRAPLSDERVAALLGVLLAGGGRATQETLAARANIPAHRIAGTITALRKVLAVEGYPVIELDSDGRTLLLNIPLLVEQFHLDAP